MFEKKQNERKKKKIQQKIIGVYLKTFTVDNKVHLVDDKHTQRNRKFFFLVLLKKRKKKKQKLGDIFVIPCDNSDTEFCVSIQILQNTPSTKRDEKIERKKRRII